MCAYFEINRNSHGSKKNVFEKRVRINKVLPIKSKYNNDIPNK
jgi:hypothetical protein